MMNEALQTIMTPNPFTIEAHETVADLEVKFAKCKVSYLPVMKDKQLVGMISTYELATKIRSNQDTQKLFVKDVMVTKIPKISPDDKVGTAAELFLDRRIHAIPVVDNGTLVGIVTPYDVLKYEFNKEYTRPILYKDELTSHLRVAI